MKKSSWIKNIAVFAAATAITGCCTTQRPQHTGASAPVSKAKAANTVYIPGGDQSCAELSIVKNEPVNVRAGQEFTYHIKVTNLTDEDLRNISLTERLNPNFEFIDASPEAELNNGGRIAHWHMPTLGAGESKVIAVKGMAKEVGTFKNCASVTYDKYLCQVVNVTSPELVLKKYAPATASACDQIPIRLVVSNPGSGIAKNVVITDTLPNGLVSMDGQKVLKFNIGDLGSNESRESSFAVRAQRSGTFTNTAVATSADLSAKAATVTRITKPMLQIVKTGPAKQFSGRTIPYTIKISNNGDGDAVNTIVQDPLPSGTQFVSADNGGGLAEGNQIVWRLGTMAPNTSKTVNATVRAVNAGSIRNIAYVSANCAERVNDDVVTQITGISALLLETIDVSDPIGVGATEEYIIQVTNQGTAADKNIRIEFELEDNMAYVGSSGATTGRFSGNKVTFAPLASLAPKAKATWRVKTKALKTGDVRSTVRLNSDMLSRPVMETEATQIY